MDSDYLTLTVGGKKFHVSNKSALSVQGSVLSELVSQENAETTFDRDPGMFRHILNAYRTGILHVPRDVCPCAFKLEMNFWKIPLKMVAPCCWKTVHEIDNEIETLKLLVGEEDKLCGNHTRGNQVDTQPESVNIVEVFDTLTDKATIDEKRKQLSNESLRTRIWLFLEEPGSSTAAKVWAFAYIFMALVSVIVYVIWSEPDVRVDLYFQPQLLDTLMNSGNIRQFIGTIPPKVKLLMITDPHIAVFVIDMVCVVFFIIEAFVHFMVCPRKKRYFFNPLNVIKFCLCFTMIFSSLLETHKNWLVVTGEPNINLGKFYFACKSFNVLRLFLIFRLRKIYNGLHILLLSVEQSVKQLLLLAFTFSIALLMYGCMIYSAEIESEMFATTWVAMWWALITMTTVGYGDYYPTTPYGYCIGSLCAITGLLVIALPVASIAGTFSDLYSSNADLQKHKRAVKQQQKQNKNMTMIENNSEIKT